MGGQALVVVTDHAFPTLDPERAVLRPLNVELVDAGAHDEAAVLEATRYADAIMTQFAPITAKVIDHLHRCRAIVRYGIGVDNVDLAAARANGIPVVNIPDYCVDEVADHSVALLLALVRKIPQTSAQVRSGIWSITPFSPIHALSRQTIGVVGLGRIGQAVAARLRPFGATLLAYDPFVAADVVAMTGMTLVDWDTLLEQCDAFTLHLPLTNDTLHMFDRSAFQSMKSGAILVNCSRGGLVDTAALVDALRCGRLSGAGIDTLEREPADPGHPLLSFPQVFVTSHCAWYSEESLRRVQVYAAREVACALKGERLQHVVNGL